VQLGPARYTIGAKSQAARRTLNQELMVRETAFRMAGDTVHSAIQQICRALANDQARNERILDDVIAAPEEGAFARSSH